MAIKYSSYCIITARRTALNTVKQLTCKERQVCGLLSVCPISRTQASDGVSQEFDKLLVRDWYMRLKCPKAVSSMCLFPQVHKAVRVMKISQLLVHAPFLNVHVHFP